MRSIDSRHQYLFDSQRFGTHLRVTIDSQDMTDLEGLNWVHGAKVDTSIDRLVSRASVTLVRSFASLSLATLMACSKLNAGGAIVDVAKDIEIDVAITANDAMPTSGDWISVFKGRIIKVSWQRDPIQIQCHDLAGVLERTFIETQRVYGSAEGVPVEVVIQQVLNDNSTGVTLYTPSGTAAAPIDATEVPGWNIKKYKQSKQSVLAALKALIQQTGWDIRYLYNASTSDWELTLVEPQREVRARGTISMTGQPNPLDSFTVNATPFAEGTDWSVGSDVSATAASMVTALNTGAEALNLHAWANPASSAVGSLTFTGQPTATETFAVNGVTFTAVAGAPTGDQFQIGATVSDTVENLVDAVNSSSTAGVVGVVSSWQANPSVARLAYAAGSAGNAIVFTEALTNCTADGGGTLGGTVAGRDAAVVVEWDTLGTAGNSITFTESLANATADGSGTLGGTVAGRDTPGSVYTFGPETYEDLTQLDVSDQDVRNRGRLRYGKADNRTAIVVEDTVSQAKYGLRYMELVESSTSQIDTESEARAMINSLVEDLKEPDAILGAPVLGAFVWTEPGDEFTFSANGEHFDNDQTLAVQSWSMNFSQRTVTTSMVLRGKPSGGVKRWFELEGGRGAGPAIDEYEDAAADNIAATAGLASIIVEFDDPRTMSPPIDDWAYSRCHVSTTSGFTPSIANLAATGRQTRFEIHGLTPGTSYYSKVVHIDGRGNVGSISPQVAVATQRVGPYHINEDREHGVLLLNRDFGAQTLDPSANMPDFWEALSGTYGSAQDIYQDTTVQSTGGRSVVFYDNSNDKEILSSYIPTSDGLLYGADVVLRRLGGAGTDSQIRLVVYFYDANKNYLFSAISKGINGSSIPTTGWTTYQLWGFRPTSYSGSARFTRLMVGFYNTSVSFGAYIDSARVYRLAAGAEGKSTINQVMPLVWTVTPTTFQTYDYGSELLTGPNTRFTAKEDGVYHLEAFATMTNFAAGGWAKIGFDVNATGAPTLTGNVAPFALINDTVSYSTMVDLVVGDTVDPYWITNQVGLTAGANTIFFRVKRVFVGET